MNNFLQFIEEDIISKKTLFSAMPTNTKTNIRKFNEKVEAVANKYEEYRLAIKKYLDTKSASFEIASTKNTEAITNTISDLEHVRFILNPGNTYFEKMGFDTLFYKISNYYDFKFDSLTEIINEFLNKFELASIFLKKEDFDYTSYVNEFMSSFLDVRSTKSDNYAIVSDMFEKIYWVNPELVEHIELNFRRLIRKHEKKFIEYIKRLQQEIMVSKTLNYEECLKKLENAYKELNVLEKETITDIIELAKAKKIDINNYFEDSKVRTTTFSNLSIDSLNLIDPDIIEKFYENLRKLKKNIKEYDNYIKFIPLIEDFKSKYFKKSTKDTDKNAKGDIGKNLKNIEAEILKNEAKLDKLNKSILSGKGKLFKMKENNLKELKFETVKQANILYELYKNYDEEYFNEKVLSVISNNFTVADLLHLYYSYDYFKKIAIKKVFSTNSYEEIIEYSDSFDLFAMNPTNVIFEGVSLDEENNLARVIVNKYRLVNINVTEDDLSDVNLFMNKIDLVLRINEIEKSDISVEKIWFMVQVARINNEKEKI